MSKDDIYKFFFKKFKKTETRGTQPREFIYKDNYRPNFIFQNFKKSNKNLEIS